MPGTYPLMGEGSFTIYDKDGMQHVLMQPAGTRQTYSHPSVIIGTEHEEYPGVDKVTNFLFMEAFSGIFK